jgi:hypothetical protein
MVMVAVPSKLLGPKQRVRQIDKQPRGNDTGQRIIEDHGACPLEQVAGVNVGDRQREKDESDRQHDDVHHRNVPDLRIL